MIAAFLWNTVYIGLLSEKYGSDVPDLLIHAVGLVGFCIALYWVWTAEPIKKRRHLIYSRPMLSLFALVTACAIIGGIIGALLWWSVYRQPAEAASHAPATQPLTISPQTINLSGFDDSTLNYDLFIHNTEDVAYYSIEVEVLIDSPIVQPVNITASQTGTMRAGDPSTNLLDIYIQSKIDKERNAYVFMFPRIGPRETRRMLLSRSPANGLSKDGKHEARLRIKSYSQEAVNFGSSSMHAPTPGEISPAEIVFQDIQLKPLKLGEQLELTVFLRNAGGKTALQHSGITSLALGYG